jgi:hypothetical protein
MNFSMAAFVAAHRIYSGRDQWRRTGFLVIVISGGAENF